MPAMTYPVYPPTSMVPATGTTYTPAIWDNWNQTGYVTVPSQQWAYWVGSSGAILTVPTNYTTGAWCYWVASSTATADTNGIWFNWVVQPSPVNGAVPYQPGQQYIEAPAVSPLQAMTPQQQAQLLAQAAERERQRVIERERWARAQAEDDRRYQERQAQRALASQKAESLLKSMLEPAQLDEYEREKTFTVTTKSGKRYRIRHGRSGNIIELGEENREVASYCVHPRVWVPDEDTMLAQKLHLEADEPGLLKIANKTTLWTPERRTG